MNNRRALLAYLRCGFVLSLFVLPHAGNAGELSMKTYDVPPRMEKNDFYFFNREPLLPNPLTKLPVGSVRAKGWLQHQLILMSMGMTGHLPELSRWCKKDGSAWMSPDGEGQYGWEELPYWLKGYGDLGYLLEDKRIIEETRQWIEAVLASQQTDGYFGPISNKKNHDIWPNMIMLNVLQSYYEYSEDKRVLPFMTRYFRWQFEMPWVELLPGSWQKIRGADNLQSIYWLYNRTGEKWLLDLATAVHERTADWSEGVASWHGVNICQSFRGPAQYYVQSHDPRHVQATERNYATVMDEFGQVPGGMFGADENCRKGYTGPRQGAETCSMVEFMLSDEILLRITGDLKYADRCEEIAFNSLPAAMTPDLKGLHYLTAPNMVQLDKENKSPALQNGGCMLAYSAWERYRCCQHNVSHGWPYFTEHLWMATPNNGLAAVLYAPSEVEAMVGNGTLVRIEERTQYPFNETIDFSIHTSSSTEFPLLLRIPGWCHDAQIYVNGHELKQPFSARSFVEILRTWQDGDTVRLELPMRIHLRTWEANKDSVTVDRGPLTYSLKIDERWERFGDSLEWPEWEVFPESPWNYGLVLDNDNPLNTFTVKKTDERLAYQPFQVDEAPIELTARAKRISDWQMDAGFVGPLPKSPVSCSEPTEEITLIPMGCARLRITAFPLCEKEE